MQESSGIIYLTKAVELVAKDVEHERIAWFDLFDEMHSVRLIKFQDGDVGVELAVGVYFVDEAGDDAACKVAATWVGEDSEAVRTQELSHHFCCRGFSVCSRDDRDAIREVR